MSKNIYNNNKSRKGHNINRAIYKKVKIMQIIIYMYQKKLIHLNNNIQTKEMNIINKKAIQKHS